MGKFPSNEAAILDLAQEVEAGLSGSTAIYPDPPFDPAELTSLINQCLGAKSSAVEAQAEAKAAITEKNAQLEALVDALKEDLRYAENTVDFDDDKLALLGWSGRKPAEPVAVPAPCATLFPVYEGTGTITLAWSRPDPATGGPVKSFRVERRQQPAGGGIFSAWEFVGIFLDTQASLTDQPLGVQLEYRVFATNTSGDSGPSPTAAAVL